MSASASYGIASSGRESYSRPSSRPSHHLRREHGGTNLERASSRQRDCAAVDLGWA